MSFFDRNIHAIESAIKIVFWGSLAILFAIIITGPVTGFTVVVMATFVTAALILHSVEETRTRWERKAVEEEEAWRERLRANREYELRRQIERLQRPYR